MHCTPQGYREDDGLYLESDTDEQLLLNIPFNQGGFLTFQKLPCIAYVHFIYKMTDVVQPSIMRFRRQTYYGWQLV